MKFYRFIALSMFGIFALVGLLFLFLPNGVISFFNILSLKMSMRTAPLMGINLYLVLSVAYMYIVTLLAFFMFRHPNASIYPFLLANAKLGSSIISFGIFLIYQPYLILITNGIVDGLLGIGCGLLYYNLKKKGL